MIHPRKNKHRLDHSEKYIGHTFWYYNYDDIKSKEINWVVNKDRADGSRTAQLLSKIGVGLIANYFHLDHFCKELFKVILFLLAKFA